MERFLCCWKYWNDIEWRNLSDNNVNVYLCENECSQ